jgi:diguanylate cyclase (GGDEF)-like protein
MDPLDQTDDLPVTTSEVRLSIDNQSLSDLVEISLRLDGIPVQAEPSENPGLIIADIAAYQDLSEEAELPVSNGRLLLLVADEVEIPAGSEYLIVPRHGNDFDLDPELLVRKVREMLTGVKPSAERNPVTGIPGTAAFEAELRERINTGERFGVVFADLNQFKNYNKAYSYARGDEMLVAIGELLKGTLERHPHPQNFLAHLGSDDFAIITSEKLAPALAEEIVDEFDDMVAGFYDVTDLARGYVVLTDRRGHETQHQLVTISLAVILSSRRPISHAAEVLDIAEELLSYLKTREIVESCCIVERRSGK